jgi:diaminopimelate decarboxylase
MRTERGPIELGGVPATELAAAYGTPLLVLDTDVLDANLARFARAGTRLGIDVCYAGKALLFVALARRIAAAGLGIDVCSLGELLTAERAGIAAARLVMHGCGKTEAELDAIASGRVRRVVVDNENELATLATRARADRPVDVLLRVNTGIEAHTHAFVRTGGEDSKFGFALETLGDAIALARASAGLRLVGVHAHLGSQLFDADPYVASAPILMDAFARMHASGAPVREVIVGGGFGVDARPDGDHLDVDATLQRITDALRHDAAERNLPLAHVGIEPGRSIVASAGTSLYRVASAKSQGARRFAIVDGGIADNPRPALYGAYHHPFLASRESEAAPVEFTVCGRSCENDTLVVAPLPGDLGAGDLLGLGTTGAYTYSMASNYNRFPKPAIAFAGGGKHRLAVRRELAEETLRYDVIDDPA